jgi:hypothetical protein
LFSYLSLHFTCPFASSMTYLTNTSPRLALQTNDADARLPVCRPSPSIFSWTKSSACSCREAVSQPVILYNAELTGGDGSQSAGGLLNSFHLAFASPPVWVIPPNLLVHSLQVDMSYLGCDRKEGIIMFDMQQRCSVCRLLTRSLSISKQIS